MDFAEYASVNSCAMVCGAFTDNDIIAQVVSNDAAVEDDNDVDEEEAPVRSLTTGDERTESCMAVLQC